MARKVKSRKFKIDKEINLDEKIIMKLIANHSDERKRAEKMLDYYDGRTDILDRKYKKPNRPTNRVNHPIASYLCSMLVGFTFGKGVTYGSENKVLLEHINELMKYNDIQELDQALADVASACGYAYEIHYTDEDSNPRVAMESTENMFVLFDNTLEENMIYAIRYWYEQDLLSDDEDEKLYVEVYGDTSIKRYKGDKDSISFTEEEIHSYGDVPVVVFPLNRSWFGAFEKVIASMDKFDMVKSDIANVMESNASKAILVVSGVAIEDDEGDKSLEADVINFSDTNAKAEYLLKNIDITAVKTYMDSLLEDIHTFSQIPPLDQEGFVASASGESLKWKCLSLEILASIFEARFRKAITRRLELVCNILNVKKSGQFDFNDIEITFTRNTPVNQTEMANLVKSLYGILPEENLFGLLPWVTDVKKLMELKRQEEQRNMDNFGFEAEDEEVDTIIEDGDVDGKEA